jgi:hypothetical protein
MDKKERSGVVPRELVEFLAARSGEQILFDRKKQPEMEIDTVEFYAPEELKVSEFVIDTWEYYANHGEAGDDPGLRYKIEGVDLIKACNDYDAEGILVYFGGLGDFGSWDCDHLIVTMFGDVDWATIEANLGRYANAQWYSHLVEQYLLRPWADDRCAGIKAEPAE